jgi:hypothetical protein
MLNSTFEKLICINLTYHNPFCLKSDPLIFNQWEKKNLEEEEFVQKGEDEKLLVGK